MRAVILDYILNNWTSLSVFVVLLIVFCYAIRRFTKWEDKHDYNHAGIERSLRKNEEEHTEILKQTREILKSIDNFSGITPGNKS